MSSEAEILSERAYSKLEPVEVLADGALPDTFVKGFHDEATVKKMTYRRLDDRFVSCIALGASAFGSVFGKVSAPRVSRSRSRARCCHCCNLASQCKCQTTNPLFLADR